MSMVEVRHRASEALQKPSMHETAGTSPGYGYLIELVAAQLIGSTKRTHRAFLGTTGAEPLRQRLTYQARDDVARPASRKTDNDAHRPRRIRLRESKARDGRQRGSARCEMEKISAGKFHF
jgi:hypothetical protein